MESTSRHTMCVVCGERVYVSYPQHPDTHTICLGREPRAKKSERKRAPDGNCFECGQRIYLPFPDHPNYHSQCLRKETDSKTSSSENSNYFRKPFRSVPPSSPPRFPTFSSSSPPDPHPKFEPSPCSIDSVLSAKNYYQVLGVPCRATRQEILSAYKQRARILHPDKNIGTEAESKIAFQTLGKAKDCLMDPVQRSRYDLTILDFTTSIPSQTFHTSFTPAPNSFNTFSGPSNTNFRDGDIKNLIFLFKLFPGLYSRPA